MSPDPPDFPFAYGQVIDLEKAFNERSSRLRIGSELPVICYVLFDQQPFVMPEKSQGQFIRIRLLSTYGDKHYIGLNNLEIYDAKLGPVLASGKINFKLMADPSMASSSSSLEDKRVPENLYNGVTSGEAYEKFFLAPYVNPKRLGHPNNLGRDFGQILVYFDTPVELSKISFWNYSKTYARATKEIEVFLDERLVFHVNLSD